MKETSKKWKSRLLSSSLPLEYEIAKYLAERDFSVSFDFPYYRKDNNTDKEFSVDIHARNYCFQTTNSECDIEILAECKYRDEGKKWLFLPEINSEDMSEQTLGYTVRKNDSFTKERFSSDSLHDFESELDFSLKGVEVNEISGEVFDKDIRHGVSQIKFALPYLLKANIEGNIYGHIEDSYPWITIPVLITNCELYLLNENFSIDSIKNASNVEDLAKKVPYLVCYSSIGPDFIQHHKNVFNNFYENVKDNKNLLEFDKVQRELKGKYNLTNKPTQDCFELEHSFKFKLHSNYSHFLVCSSENFPKLLDKIILSIKNLNTLTKIVNNNSLKQ